MPGGLLRTLPLVPIVGFVGFAFVLVFAYRTDAIWAPSCFSVVMGVECPSMRMLWLSLAVAWTTSALVLAVFMVLKLRRSPERRGVRTSGLTLLISGLAVTILGGIQFWVATNSGFGRLPASLGTDLLFAYITSSLFLFGVAFLDYEPRRGPIRAWATVLALVNGLCGLALGSVAVLGILNPPVFA